MAFSIDGGLSLYPGTTDEAPTEPRLDFDPPSVKIRERFLQLSIRPYRVSLLASDSTYRLSYRIRRGSSGTTVQEGAVWSGNLNIGEPVDLWAPENYLETFFSTEISVQRPPGHELGRVQTDVKIKDLFDRSHPYARWHHEHWWFEPARPLERRTKLRPSAIHKTDIRERCKFGDMGTSPHPREYTIQALDAVPAPAAPDFTTRLCPYCFRQS
jgi:hypothetical protein